MIDSQFIQTLQELRAKGEAGKPEMRELLKNGNLDRLIELAALGVGKQAKTARKTSATRIGDDFPGQDEKEKAIGYWERKRRPDLVARVEEIAEGFHSHHLSKGTRSESWPHSWLTWYRQSLEFIKPPRAGGLFEIVTEPVFEQCNAAGWVQRLRVYYESDSRAWPHKWGGKPPENPSDAIPSGCRCPAQAFALYLTERKRRGGSDAAHA